MKINWDQSAATPTEKTAAPVVTGISAPKPADAVEEFEWTAEDLKAGKPMMVYYFVGETKPTEANYKICRKTEMSAFSNDAIERINKNFVAKKVEIDIDADRKLAKNQARIEFWSFTGKKMDTVAQKNQQILNPSDFETRLKEMEKKNREICNAEIKRMNDEIERRKQQDTAAK
jgi:hypothetical protein